MLVARNNLGLVLYRQDKFSTIVFVISSPELFAKQYHVNALIPAEDATTKEPYSVNNRKGRTRPLAQ